MLEAALGGFGECKLIEHVVMTNADPKAVNTKVDPLRVAPRPISGARVDGGVLQAPLPPLSWNVLRLKTAAP